MVNNTSIAFMIPHLINSISPGHKADTRGELLPSKNNLNAVFRSLHEVTCGLSCTAQSAEVTRPKSTDPRVPSHPPLPSPPYGPDGIKSWALCSFQSCFLCTGQNDPSPWNRGTSVLPTKSNDG